MATLTNTIPEKTIERLSEYRRTLLASHRQGITHIFSHVLAGIHGITAVQVRRDLMLIGFSSDTKKGYDVQVLIEYISRILDSPSAMNIAVLGMGHLGQAITKYFNGKGLKLKITAAFDVDPEKGRQNHRRHPVLPHGLLRGRWSRTRTSRSSSSPRRRRWPRISCCRSSTPAYAAC